MKIKNTLIKNKTCKIIVCTVLITCLFGTVQVMADESLYERAKVIGDYRQDEVEDKLDNFIEEVYNATSEMSAERATKELSDIMTDQEIKSLKDDLGYNRYGYSVQEVNIYYISKENSYDGRKREFIDLKVGNEDVNYMYMIEFKINDDEKIFSHTIWRH